ncbi:hypothetical protein P171DRAFT_494790, partial [Karstenula rhodostoma CBS 690.94]
LEVIITTQSYSLYRINTRSFLPFPRPQNHHVPRSPRIDIEHHCLQASDMSPTNKSGDKQTIYVYLESGEEKKMWTAPLGLVLRSSYLSDKYKTMLKSADQIYIDLPADSTIDGAETYISFVLASMYDLSHMPKIKSAEAIIQSYRNFACVYLLARPRQALFGDKETRNDVMKAMVELSQIECIEGYTKPPPAQVVTDLWMAVPEGHGMQTLLVDLWAHADHKRVCEEIKDFPSGKLPKQFTMKLLVALLQHVATSDSMKNALIKVLQAAQGTKDIPRTVKTADPYLE